MITVDNYDCRLHLTLQGAVLNVEQQETYVCGGHRVSFEGAYTKGRRLRG